MRETNRVLPPEKFGGKNVYKKLKKSEPNYNFCNYIGERSKNFRKAWSKMKNDDFTEYYDYLIRHAVSKCNSQTDAEDLVGDTMLAAYAFIRNGGIITHPKTWLYNTLNHIFNSNLRKKYRLPVTVCLDDAGDIPTIEDGDILPDEEAAKVRKELNHLAQITREVLIRFYYGNQSVAEIADRLGIPEGTVKSRLSAGRSQMKKGLETMEAKENHLPGQLCLSYGGMEGQKGEPVTLVDDDLIAQNLLILAYEKPLTVSELSKAISIPAAYIEPIIKKLVDGELMVQTDSGKVYSDFIITTPQSALENYKSQLEFAHKHFESVWQILRKMSDLISKQPFVQDMTPEERTKLDRYAVIKALQDFQHSAGENIPMPQHPNRKDGGRWTAQAVAFEAGYNTKEYQEAMQFAVQGGHRTTEAVSVGNTKRIRLYEFDTALWDCPHRYGSTSTAFELYFKHIIPLLWYIHSGIPLEASDIPNEFISYIPSLETYGMIDHSNEKLHVSIPVIDSADYSELCKTIHIATEEMQSLIGQEFFDFIKSMKTRIPKHLTTVPDLYRYYNATEFFVMSIVREAYDKQLHLKDVDYCCPPVVLVYEA